MNETKLKEAIQSVRNALIDAQKAAIDTDLPDRLDIIKELMLVDEKLAALNKQIPKLIVTAQTALSELKDRGIITVRAATMCQRSGCLTVGDLCCHTQEEITRFRCMGERCSAELISTLKEYGFIIPSECDILDEPSEDEA